ncbi:LacI family transcriptional regulator [Sodalis praecaptivus]|uniref:LacI family transcriptional regulator n=1 Tax=Sodalis praecaptivus TaxID=1239307 RepID=W0HVM5_9GAMM|nr:substrate-binding domain-containing protein [Sodalis praecaptivus]AHF76557.1 LacI family transcriptional regulator [Sodalis praecaptivus]
MSLKAIAKTLGLSVTTVSRAINGYSDVSATTRERVLAEANRLEYRPNALARRLKMGRTEAVGLVYPLQPRVLNNAAFLEMIGSISCELAHGNIDLLLVSDKCETQPPAYIRLIESQRVDALIVAHTLEQDERLSHLRQHALPFLALGRSGQASQHAWFDFDNYQGGVLAVEHLARLGHRRIAWLGSSNRQMYVQQRLEGYLAAMRQAGLPCPAEYQRRVEANRRAGFLATRELLALPAPPTAIITDCDALGDGAANALQQAGLLARVSLIVYDGLPVDTVIPCHVTAVVQATRAEVGRQIAVMTRALMAGTPATELQVLWQPTLEEGETTRAPWAP